VASLLPDDEGRGEKEPLTGIRARKGIKREENRKNYPVKSWREFIGGVGIEEREKGGGVENLVRHISGRCR